MPDLPAAITPGGIPDGPRRRTQASTRLLHEWSGFQPWIVPPTYELRLGPTPLTTPGVVLTPALEAQLRVSNSYADLIGITETEIQVVEAKVVATSGAISQLEEYLTYLPLTPILREYAGRSIVGVLLWAVDKAVPHQMANARGLRVIIYTPSWIQDYLNQKWFRPRTVA